MPKTKETTTVKTTTNSKRGHGTTKKSLSSTADAERARKEALRAEVLALYSKKQSSRVVDEENGNGATISKDVAEGINMDVESVGEREPVMKNAYTTPFFGTNKVDSQNATISATQNQFQEEKNENAMTSTNETDNAGKIGSFEEFSRTNYNKKDSPNNFDGGNYVGLSQKTQKTKIISEKTYNRSPRFEKFKRFLSYLFATKEGWYYILGSLCLIFIIVLFFI